jgi:hypothetical protein
VNVESLADLARHSCCFRCTRSSNVKVNNFGSITAVATALDAAGNVGTATQAVAAIDTSDVTRQLSISV